MSTRPLDPNDPHDPGREEPNLFEEELPVLETWEPLADEAQDAPEVIELPPPEQTPPNPGDDAPREPQEPPPPKKAPGGGDTKIETGRNAVAAEPPAPDDALQPGDVLAGRYEILRPLPFDGPGAAYAILDRYIQDKEALRVLPAKGLDARVRSRLARELRAARAVKHAGIAALFDEGSDAERGLSFITMELVEGTTLAEVLRERGGRLPVWESLDVARRLCEALGAAHRHTAHLGLNPHNIVLLPDGTVKILDLGLPAALPRHALLQAAVAGGTQPFLAPELKNPLIDGDRRADVYSLGAILYHMLTGSTPADPAVPPSHLAMGVPAGIDRIVLQCLRRRPAERPRDMRIVKKALQHALVPRKGRPVLWAAIAASLLALVAAVLLPKLQSATPDEPATRTAQRAEPQDAPPPIAAEPPVAKVEPATAPMPEPPAPAAVEPAPEPAPVPEVAAEPVLEPAPAPDSDPASVPAPPPLPGAPAKPANEPAWTTDAAAPPVRQTPAPRPMARAVPEAVPAEPAEIAPAAAQPPPGLTPQVRTARAAALRARTEARAIGAERGATESFAQGLSALNEADGWVNAGWADDAAEQYRLAERHFRRAIDDTLHSSHVIEPDRGLVSPAPATPATREAAPAHSIQLARITGGREGTIQRAEITFNLLGGGQRTQAFRVGDEVADGWRLEAIDPDGPSVRLRNGNRATVLSAPGAPRASTPSPPPAAEADPSRVALEVAAVVQDWVRTAEAQEAGPHAALYADTVASYFNARNVPRRTVHADKLNFFGKYDRIDLDVRNINVQPRPDGSAVVTFDKRWDAQGPGNNFSGDEKQELVLRKAGGEWKIVSERELKVYWVRR